MTLARDAIAVLKREFSLSPTLPAGGISVLPHVALGLCDELTLAYDALERAERVVESARAILRDEQNDEQSDLSYDHLSSQRYNALNRIRSALAAYDTTRADTVRALPPLPTFEPATVEGIADVIRGNAQHNSGKGGD